MTGDPQSTSVPPSEPAELRWILVERFNLEELRTLCQDLRVDHDSLPGEGKEAKARELVAYCERQKRTPDLEAAISRAKPEPPVPGECPFKGLQYFDEADADLFFCRERLMAELARRLRLDRFLAIVGTSGSCKPSIVRAVLAPALKCGEQLADKQFSPEGSTRRSINIVTPTTHPLEALAPILPRSDFLGTIAIHCYKFVIPSPCL